MSLQLDPGSSVASPAGGGAAIRLTSRGGIGGDGGQPANRGAGGTPSAGSAGGVVGLGLVAGSTVTSTPQDMPAIRLDASGGDGGLQPIGSDTNTDTPRGKDGGDGGAGGTVQTLSGGIAGIIKSSGIGIQALSQGGRGNNGGSAGGNVSVGAYGGNGGKGGTGGAFFLLLSGQGGSIQARGPAQAATGSQILVDGPGNSTYVVNTSISSAGILAQSLGGAGGFGGGASGNGGTAHSGSGGDAGAGGSVTVSTTGGTVATTGYGAAGILALSAGGAGGSAGNAGSFVRSHGGNGAAGGAGGGVTVDLCFPSCQANPGPPLITTTGEDSDAVVAQSIGGSGGYGGDVSVGGIGVTIALGGAGANGGQAQDVTAASARRTPEASQATPTRQACRPRSAWAALAARATPEERCTSRTTWRPARPPSPAGS